MKAALKLLTILKELSTNYVSPESCSIYISLLIYVQLTLTQSIKFVITLKSPQLLTRRFHLRKCYIDMHIERTAIMHRYTSNGPQKHGQFI